ncbi:SAV_2336 N-terminal domain-related protein [Streptomyces sp. ID05-39B]|uniref:SAV_2336 N-terminal domain-related protein n=1 Tax=Streptomyces sp. ID05-39B TaxID=3028664 RepID=UPI0029A75081|nr:SAV_2336 N-terminal domain-related protein [Streptomyces sp. ID05-39B]MDX3530376.1 SAV_2336 N-terminal domain-related protein [Streptomyces sp. ID05-39B]
MRPLKRTVPAARARLLDERATADRIARFGAHPDVWLPVLRPARERWLRLALVHDTGPTMPVWRPLVRELHTVLAQSGIFRTVTLHPAGPDGRAEHVPDPADGRTLTLVVSDCMGPQWRPGPAGARWYATLRHWASRMPLAVVQPLPEHLWPTTAFPAEPGVLASPGAAAPPAALTFAPYDPDAARPHPAAFPVPVLEPGAAWLAHWAALVAGPGGAHTPGAAAWLSPAPPEQDRAADPGSLPAQDLVLRFRATASPEAFRLAGHLALADPSVPVMRLVQRAVERDPRPQHLAEVILSGMLTAVPGPPGSYAFRPGVGELLQRTLPRTARGRTRDLLERMGRLIDARAGLVAGEFRARTGTGSAGTAFATVSEDTVRRLGAGGRNAVQEAEQNEQSKQAEQGRSAGQDSTAWPTLRFETDTDLGTRPEARISLEYAVHQVLSRGGLTPQQYEVLVRPDGYRVRVDPGVFLLPVLAAALRWLPGPLTDRAEAAPRLRVTFQDGFENGFPDGFQNDSPGGFPGGQEAVPPQASAPVLVVVPPALYEAFADSSAAAGPHRFRPLYGAAPDAPPLAWYCPLPAPRAEEEPDLVRGPFIATGSERPGIPVPGRSAVVHLWSAGPLTLLDPAGPHAGPHAGRPARPMTYYEVDLTPQHAGLPVSLPSSGKGEFVGTAMLTWWVEDPVAFVRAGTARVADRLLAHLLETAPRITRHHSPRRAAGAQRALDTQLGRWPVPGLAVRCAVRLAPEWAPPPAPPSAAPATAASPTGLLAGADAVLLGFDGPVTRLFTASAAREAARDLLAVAAARRGPRDAEHTRVTREASEVPAREVLTHPLDVLRVYARDELGPLLRARLDELELAAVPHAPTTHNCVALVRALQESGRRVAVVTDVCEEAVRRYVEPYRLLLDGVHGRGPHPAPLMPDPGCLRRALRSLGVGADAGVLIGSTVAELTAAQQAGLRFVGLARNPTVEQDLRAAGCAVTVRSLTEVLEAARAL